MPISGYIFRALSTVSVQLAAFSTFSVVCADELCSLKRDLVSHPTLFALLSGEFASGSTWFGSSSASIAAADFHFEEAQVQTCDSLGSGNFAVWSSTPTSGPSDLSSMLPGTIDVEVKVTKLTTQVSLRGSGPSVLKDAVSRVAESGMFTQGVLDPVTPSWTAERLWPFSSGPTQDGSTAHYSSSVVDVLCVGDLFCYVLFIPVGLGNAGLELFSCPRYRTSEGEIGPVVGCFRSHVCRRGRTGGVACLVTCLLFH